MRMLEKLLRASTKRLCYPGWVGLDTLPKPDLSIMNSTILPFGPIPIIERIRAVCMLVLWREFFGTLDDARV